MFNGKTTSAGSANIVRRYEPKPLYGILKLLIDFLDSRLAGKIETYAWYWRKPNQVRYVSGS